MFVCGAKVFVPVIGKSRNAKPIAAVEGRSGAPDTLAGMVIDRPPPIAALALLNVTIHLFAKS